MDDYEIGNGEGPESPDNGKVGLFYASIIQNKYIFVWLINQDFAKELEAMRENHLNGGDPLKSIK